MPRIRSVKPEICVDEKLAETSAEVERTYVRLWTHCDDEGRCVDNPKLIKAAIYPLHDAVTPAMVDADLAVLEAKGMIVRYVVDDKRYLVVVTWHRHQKPQHPAPSKLPPPPAPGEDSESDPVQVREPSRKAHEDVANAHEELAPVVVVGEGEGEGEGVGDKRDVVGSASPPTTALARRGPVELVFESWCTAAGKNSSTVLTDKRRRLIRKALAAYPLDEVTDAVRGWRKSPWHRGENDRHTVYNSIELLLRDAEHIEKFRDLERGGHVVTMRRPPKGLEGLAAFADRHGVSWPFDASTGDQAHRPPDDVIDAEVIS